MDALPTEIHQIPQLFLLSPSPYGEQRMYPLKYDGNHLLTKNKHAIVSQFKSMGSYYDHDFVLCNLFGFTRRIATDGRSFFLVNPLKGEVLMLPTTSDLQVPPNSLCNNDTYGMGFDNMTNSYKIVRVSRHLKEDHKTEVVLAEVLVLGTSSWRVLPSAPPCYPFGAVATFTHGAVHWLVHNNHRSSSVHILSFDFKNEEFYWTPHPLALKIQLHLSLFVHLLNFRGSLALVDVSSSDIVIWVLVLKNYNDKKKHKWVLYYKIYMHTLPLRLGTRAYGVFDFGEWEHGIFFHESHQCRRSVFFVDLTRRSMKSVLLKDRQTHMTIHSCTDNMISLKNYGDLVEEEEQWHSKVIL